MTERLDETLSAKVDALRKKFVEEEVAQNFESCLAVLTEGWALIPEPKTDYDESYHFAAYRVDTLINLGRLEEAQTWAATLQKCNLDRHDSGEREYYAGKVEVELGNNEEALRLLRIAKKKSRSRVFSRSSAKKYKAFLKAHD